MARARQGGWRGRPYLRQGRGAGRPQDGARHAAFPEELSACWPRVSRRLGNCRRRQMKWTLLVLIYVKTELVFDTIDDCLKAEEQMRGEYARLQRVAHLGRGQSKGGTVSR